MHRTRLPRRTATAALRRCAAICAIAAVIAGCGTKAAPLGGSVGGSGTGSARPAGGTGSTRPASRTGAASPATGPAGADTGACLPSDIRVTLDIHSAGVAAGTSYFPLDFTNVSHASCRLAGYPVVTFGASLTGQQIGAAGAADRNLATEDVVLAAGQTAHIWLQLADVMNFPSAQCRPVTAAGLRIGLPGQGAATFIARPTATCAKQVSGTQILTVEPFRPGQARPGTAQ